MENRKYNNYKKLSNIQKYYLIVNAAKIVHKRFNYLLDKKSGLHWHHIKPKSLYPDLANDKENLIKVPAIVHWALHKILLDYYKEINNEVAIKKMSYVNLEDFINNFYKNRKKKFNFKEFEVEFINDDISHNFLIYKVLICCKHIIYSEIYLQLLKEECNRIEKAFREKKIISINTDEYEQYKQKGKYYKEYRSELNAARKKLLDTTKNVKDDINKYYVNLTEYLLDMYGKDIKDIKDELDDCYKSIWDLYNTLNSIEEEDPLEKLPNIPDEELREGLNEKRYTPQQIIAAQIINQMKQRHIEIKDEKLKERFYNTLRNMAM